MNNIKLVLNYFHVDRKETEMIQQTSKLVLCLQKMFHLLKVSNLATTHKMKTHKHAKYTIFLLTQPKYGIEKA